MVKVPAGLSKVLALSFGKGSESSGQSGFEVWISNDASTAAAIVDRILVMGDRSAVIAALRKEGKQSRVVSSAEFDALRNSNASAVTVAQDSTVYGFRVSNDNSRPLYLSETSFSESGITRRYISRFGLIGTIIAGFDNQ